MIFTFATNLKSLRSELPSEYNLQVMEELLTCSYNKSDLFHLYTLSREIDSWGRNLLESLLIKQEEHASFYKLYSPEERYMYLLAHEPIYSTASTKSISLLPGHDQRITQPHTEKDKISHSLYFVTFVTGALCTAGILLLL